MCTPVSLNSCRLLLVFAVRAVYIFPKPDLQPPAVCSPPSVFFTDQLEDELYNEQMMIS